MLPGIRRWRRIAAGSRPLRLATKHLMAWSKTASVTGCSGLAGLRSSPWLAAYLIAMLATPAGISGAVLLLPFQVSVLGTPSPAVTPTNLLYNVVATPGALYRYWRQKQTGGRWP